MSISAVADGPRDAASRIINPPHCTQNWRFKLAFHDTNTDTNIFADIIARIVARMSACR